MYRINVTELAHQDLDKIIRYIAVELANPTAAGDFLDEVDKCYGYLKSNPCIYSKCQNKRLEKEGYRRAPINNYLLVYKTDEESRTVFVLRFFYGAQDYISLI
ncbi:MAG: type II toxin-antitoxin system RelE/ParE family toxin [Clostridiaceae bacterium]|jgi:plasmid stabilization system protein ParE|nr:type II toxin-antitoxin system RelE/ParE family toxin [Clostridiaceae bacterium]